MVSLMENQEKIELLTKMIRVRCFEEVVIEKKEQNIILGPVHTTIGQEATDVGVCSALSQSDYIIGTHRSHGYMVAKGTDLNAMMAEIYGKSTGTNGGKGGSMHVSDISNGSLGASGVVGSGMPLACGSGFASKYRKEEKITCVFFGDGAAHEGTFHESLNLAAVWNLPIIFLLKNNGLAITTTLKQTTLTEDFYTHAEAYGMQGYKVDGQNVEEVYECVSSAIQHIKEGKGPVLIEAKAIRFREHQEGLGYKKIANANYRDNEQVKLDILQKDPIANYVDKLLCENVITNEDVDVITKKEKESVLNAVRFAENSPLPTAKDAYTNVFSGKC
jgi:acetoin:2,6-dichlorophenolindophenol oxidoreductase subunit alpha